MTACQGLDVSGGANITNPTGLQGNLPSVAWHFLPSFGGRKLQSPIYCQSMVLGFLCEVMVNYL